MTHKKTFTFLVIILLASAAFWYVSAERDNTNTDDSKKVTKADQQQKNDEDSFDKSEHSLDDPNSIWVVVNKRRPLTPRNYQPSDLVVPDVRLRVPGHETMKMRAEAASALEEMFNAADKDEISLMLSSAHRSYTYQDTLYSGYVRTQGQEVADTQSARPGYSEHQTGLAADVRPINGECELEICFGDMAEGQWVAKNAHKFGFIIRYTQDNTAVAGYSYEPWHIRYVGTELSNELHDQNISTLEDFFNLPAAPDYN